MNEVLGLTHVVFTCYEVLFFVAHDLVVDGGNSVQLWRVAASTLDAHLQTTDKGCSSSLVNKLTIKWKLHITKCHIAFGLGWIVKNNLSNSAS
jgi:hypothetical protein